jgi:hypothetical protein
MDNTKPTNPTQEFMQALKALNPKISDVRLLQVLDLPTGDRGLMCRMRAGQYQLPQWQFHRALTRSREAHGKVVQPGRPPFVSPYRAPRQLGLTWHTPKESRKIRNDPDIRQLAKAVDELGQALSKVRNLMQVIEKKFEYPTPPDQPRRPGRAYSDAQFLTRWADELDPVRPDQVAVSCVPFFVEVQGQLLCLTDPWPYDRLTVPTPVKVYADPPEPGEAPRPTGGDALARLRELIRKEQDA